MGMFDYIRYDADCKECGAPLGDFQSKDHDCLLNKLEPSQVDNFYTNCKECGTWHNFEVTRECIVKHIEVSTK